MEHKVSSFDWSCLGMNCEHPIVRLHPNFWNAFIRSGIFSYGRNDDGTLHIIDTDGMYSDSFSSGSAYRSSHFSAFYKRYFSLQILSQVPELDYNKLCSDYCVYAPVHDFDYVMEYEDQREIFGDSITIRGQIYVPVCPIYLAVPCGHCDLCQKTKRDELAMRCELETFASDSKPLFVTATFDDKHLPHYGFDSMCSGCVHAQACRDCYAHDPHAVICRRCHQLFMKRLRTNVARYLGVPYSDVKVRFVCGMEYGHSNVYTARDGSTRVGTTRPHFHYILWNLPFIKGNTSRKVAVGPLSKHNYASLASYTSFQALTNFIQDSWSYGYVNVQICKSPSARYVAKYLAKGCEKPSKYHPDGCVLTSRRRGIGYPAFEKLRSQLKDPHNTDLHFVDPKYSKSSSVRSLPIPHYFRTLLYPCASVFLGKKITDLVKFFNREISELDYLMNSDSVQQRCSIHLSSDPQAVDVLKMYLAFHAKWDAFSNSLGLDLPLSLADRAEMEAYVDDFPSTRLRDIIQEKYWRVAFIFPYLMDYHIDLDSYYTIRRNKFTYQEALKIKNADKVVPSIVDRAFAARNEYNDLINKSIL